jgi:hypothetical protein
MSLPEAHATVHAVSHIHIAHLPHNTPDQNSAHTFCPLPNHNTPPPKKKFFLLFLFPFSSFCVLLFFLLTFFSIISVSSLFLFSFCLYIPFFSFYASYRPFPTYFSLCCPEWPVSACFSVPSICEMAQQSVALSFSLPLSVSEKKSAITFIRQKAAAVKIRSACGPTGFLPFLHPVLSIPGRSVLIC